MSEMKDQMCETIEAQVVKVQHYFRKTEESMMKVQENASDIIDKQLMMKFDIDKL